MKHLLHPEALAYHGPELASHWIYRQFGLQGDAIVAFAGPAEVHIKDMVDLEDVKMKAHIHSEQMLHFLIEHFQTPLPNMVLRQRLLTAQIQDVLHHCGATNVTRKGDDLMDGAHKLSVSIATVSPVSGLIHFGINISSQNTPVLTKGLIDYGLDWQVFAERVLKTYVAEHDSIAGAVTKVRWVN